MASDFSRTLALLRREKKISQRTAAGDLGVSQALLSHYENGLREPGLSFVVRAADYYGVSCDYLLGRSMARDGSAVPAERMDISVGSEQEKSQILNAAALLLELAEATGSEQLPHEIEAYLAIAIYKVYRYLYLADPGSIEAVLEFYEKAVQELEFLSNSSEKAAELSAKKAAEEKRLSALAETLTARRRATAEQVEAQIETSLHDMEMKHARFHIQIEEKADWGADGKDKVEFLISANAGEPLKPLAKIASGGEMSRVMLALKTVLVDADEIGTFIFDEIDTGVSGRTARRVGEKMRFLGGKRQLLCITHLPQIAAMADNHFLIEKESDAGETVTRVTALDEEGAVREVARLMNDVTETTLAAARELLAEK